MLWYNRALITNPLNCFIWLQTSPSLHFKLSFLVTQDLSLLVQCSALHLFHYANKWALLIALSSVAVVVLPATLWLLFQASVTLWLLLELSASWLMCYLWMLVTPLVTAGAHSRLTVAFEGIYNLVVTTSTSGNHTVTPLGFLTLWLQLDQVELPMLTRLLLF